MNNRITTVLVMYMDNCGDLEKGGFSVEDRDLPGAKIVLASGRKSRLEQDSSDNTCQGFSNS